MEQDFSGMTVNERLFVAGLLDVFEDAARRRDATEMRSILTRVSISSVEAEDITKAILERPDFYGF